ncbi:MAG: glutathione peroxidase [Clostridia bacterium]|nr:glutathione peroxidase [Clostridia bacterium]
MSIYDYKVKGRKGAEVALADYEGKVLLIVNTATGCGFTPQYKELQEIYDKYKAQGLEILDFPCNQFGNQAPGTEEEIASFCTGRFGITFPQLAKIEVNGENEEPLYTYLKAQKGFEGFDANHPLSAVVAQIVEKIDPNYANNSNIKWNFTKFLVNRKGEVVARFEPMVAIADIEAKIKEVL